MLRYYWYYCLALLLLLVPATASAVVIGDFETGDTVGWRLVGGSPYMAHYRVEAVPGGYRGDFALRVIMATNQGWCGVAAPAWRQPPVVNPTAITLAVRAPVQTPPVPPPELLIDVHQTDGERWWCIVPVPADGSWLPVRATADRFFQVDKPTGSKTPDFTKIKLLWLSIRGPAGRDKLTDPPPAMLDLDEVGLEGQPAVVEEPLTPALRPGSGSSTLSLGERGLGPISLRGVTVLLADTGSLPRLGQSAAALAGARAALGKAGATVQTVRPGSLGTLRPGSRTVLVWEGPACREGDWRAVEAYLRRGGALLWWGVGVPFSRPVSAAGKALPTDAKPGEAISWGIYQEMHALEAEGPWTLTPAGQRLWGIGARRRSPHPNPLPVGEGMPAGPPRGGNATACLLSQGERAGVRGSSAPTFPAVTCRYLTLNDSLHLQTHWPWVEVVPLVTFGYTAGNWVSEQHRFTGSVATLYRHRAGDWAGARLLVVTTGQSNALFPSGLPAAVAELLKPVTVEKLPAPARPRPVTRATFFVPGRAIGALDWEAADWGKPGFREMVRRLGLNVLHTGVPWRDQPDAQGNLVDWAVADRRVAQAEAGGWAVVFDPYCFGYDRYAWATEGPAGPGTAAPASIMNPVFRERFIGAMAALARRYAKRPSVVALFATPDTTVGGFGVEDSPLGREAWGKYAAARGLPADLPQPPEKGRLDLSPGRAAYIDFHAEQYAWFMRPVIEAIRREAPDMPLLLRGAYLDTAHSFRLAAEYKAVAPHCECVETGIDVETYMRGFAERYGVPASAENGWPKARGAALRMACATVLLGGYRDLLFSFGGPGFARPGLAELQTLERVWAEMERPVGETGKMEPLTPALSLRERGKGRPDFARYTPAKLGLLIPDTTIWASEPPNFFSVQDRPNITQLLERSGIPYLAVSAQWPKLDGLSVLVDDGRNDVLPAASRAAIIEWVRAGGTLVAFPGTGRYDAAGGSGNEEPLTPSLSLGERGVLGQGLGVEAKGGEYAVGKGRVIVLAAVPKGPAGPEAAAVLAALRQAGCTPAIRVEPAVNQAVFVKGNRRYLVLYNKSPQLVGSWFDEIRIPEVVAKLPNLRLTVWAPPGAISARELVNGKPLPIKDGTVEVALPATQWRVVEFTVEERQAGKSAHAPDGADYERVEKGAVAMAAQRDIQTIVPHTPEHPRNGEGDIIELRDGSLLLGYGRWEADGSDFGRAEIWGKVSRDGGRTWGEDRVLVPNEGKCTTFETGFLRLPGGDILMSYCVKDSTEDCSVCFRTSHDDGKTWTDRQKYAIPRPAYTGYTGINNDRLVLLSTGRVLLPVYDGWVDGKLLVCMTLYSDDQGRTWQLSDPVSIANLAPQDKFGCCEPAVVELLDGRVLMILRTGLGIIARAYSSDGGATWGKPEPIPGIVCSNSPASIARLPWTGDLLLIWEDSPTGRDPLACAISTDEGQTWGHKRVLDRGGTFCYTSITPVGDEVLLTYYGPPSLSLKMQRIPWQWFYEGDGS